MGIKCSLYEIDKIINTYNDFLIVSLLPTESFKGKFMDFEILNLGQTLSRELIQVEKDLRDTEVENVTKRIFSQTYSNRIIATDIDILFNPSYKLDVIKLFIQLSRNKTVIVQWPGKIDSNYLIYSEPQYDDYKKYDIKDYNIICLR